jgi:hypothetical protein
VEKQHCLPDNLRFQGLVAKLIDQELFEKVASEVPVGEDSGVGSLIPLHPEIFVT